MLPNHKVAGEAMKFAFAGIDFLGGVFEGLVAAGWSPIKLFTRPCDGIYDHNEVVVGRARSLRVPDPAVANPPGGHRGASCRARQGLGARRLGAIPGW